MFRFFLFYAAFSFGFLRTQANPSLTADQIMRQVGANQDRSEELRRHYVYRQQVRITSHKRNGKLLQDETDEYLVVPHPDASTKKLTSLSGKYWHNDKYVDYSGQQTPNDGSLDGELLSELRDALVNEKQTKDGFATDLFPLTSKEQRKYVFKLVGEEGTNGRKIYRIAFRPKAKSDTVWKGEALIDAEEFQPVTVFTKLSRRVPFWIRTSLGTDLPDIGFSVTYKPQPDGCGSQSHLERNSASMQCSSSTARSPFRYRTATLRRPTLIRWFTTKNPACTEKNAISRDPARPMFLAGSTVHKSAFHLPDVCRFRAAGFLEASCRLGTSALSSDQ